MMLNLMRSCCQTA